MDEQDSNTEPTEALAEDQTVGDHVEVDPTPAQTPRRRFRSPVLAAVAAGVIGISVGAGAVALVGGNDSNGEHRDGGDRASSADQQMPGQVDGQMDRQQRGGFDQDGHRGTQGSMVPGQQVGGFMPPQGGGPTQGRTGGS